jgi:hypothetical protein
MIIGVIAIVLWITSVLGYVIWNLNKKNKELENMVINHSNFISETIGLLDDFNTLVNKIDSTMWVQSDPELIQMFEAIKQIQQKIQMFTGRK